MKTVSYIIFAFVSMIMFSATSVSAQSNGDQTISFKVYGVCDDCKQRIEAAAMDSKGVKKAEWDKMSNTLVLVGSSKMTKEKVAASVAKAGYKSDIMEADPEGYAKLPTCCQYGSDEDKH
jgi:hypothetical protein